MHMSLIPHTKSIVRDYKNAVILASGAWYHKARYNAGPNVKFMHLHTAKVSVWNYRNSGHVYF